MHNNQTVKMTHHLSLAELKSFDSRGGHNGRFLCTLCGTHKPRDGAHRSLAVSTNTGAWMCHRCGGKGLLREFWTARDGAASPGVRYSARERGRRAAAHAFALPEDVSSYPVTERRTAITHDAHDGASPETNATDAKKVDFAAVWKNASRLINRRETIKSGIGEELSVGAQYLAGRALDVNRIDGDTARYAPDFYGRAAVLFPVYNRAGELVAVSGRFINSQGKFTTQTAGRKSDGVFATPDALESSIVAVCEAPIDALALWQCGVPAIALIGCSAPAWLFAAFAWRDVLLATDADKGGDGAAARLTAEIEARGGRTFRLRARGAKDWNEALQQRGQDALRTSLAPFTPTCTDELRAMHALDLRRAGRMDAARFVAGLIGKAMLRECVRARLRSSEPDAVGELLDDIHIPAKIMNDESLAARCLDAQRLPASFVVTSAA